MLDGVRGGELEGEGIRRVVREVNDVQPKLGADAGGGDGVRGNRRRWRWRMW